MELVAIISQAIGSVANIFSTNNQRKTQELQNRTNVYSLLSRDQDRETQERSILIISIVVIIAILIIVIAFRRK